MELKLLQGISLVLLWVLLWPAVLASAASVKAHVSGDRSQIPAYCAPDIVEAAPWWDEAALKEAVATILLSQDRGGAFQLTPSSTRIVPYFGNYAALGLIAAYRLELVDDSALDRVHRWIRWYAERMDPETGVITDYTGRFPVYTSTRDFDSSDAYAGTFSAVIWAWYDVTKDRQALEQLWPAVVLAVKAMRLTQQADGLTWAKPDYKVKYLMDNVEVWLGFKAASLIASELEKEDAADWSAEAERVRTAVETLYRKEGVPYLASSIGSSGALNLQLTRLYPDGLANYAYLAVLGSPETPGDRAIYEAAFGAFYSEQVPEGSGAMHIWGVQAACVMGDIEGFARVMEVAGDATSYAAQAHSLGSLLRVAAGLKGHPLWF